MLYILDGINELGTLDTYLEGSDQWRSGSGAQNWAISFSTVYVAVIGSTTNIAMSGGYKTPRISSLTTTSCNWVAYWTDGDNEGTDNQSAYRLGIGK